MKIKCRVDSCRKQMLLGNVTRITWIIAMTQCGSRICGQVQISWADLAFLLPFSYWYVPFTHIMSRKCRKLQLRALVGRFGSQNAMVGRLDDLGAGRTMSYINMDDFFQYRLKRSGTNKVTISRLGPEWDQLAKMVSSRPDYHFQQIFSVFTVF